MYGPNASAVKGQQFTHGKTIKFIRTVEIQEASRPYLCFIYLLLLLFYFFYEHKAIKIHALQLSQNNTKLKSARAFLDLLRLEKGDSSHPPLPPP